MYTKCIILFIACSVLCWATGCIKPYEPPEITEAPSLLVVEGMLQGGNSSTATIKLSRTMRLGSTDSSAPEQGARVTVEGSAQERYVLAEGPDGTYSATGLSLQPSGKYRLFIETRSGTVAASEFVSFKQTPPIDSLSWKEDEGTVTVFLDTHDPQNNTRYYRWTFDETWEYRAAYDANAAYENGVLFFRDTTDLRYRCWQTSKSLNILLGASASLTEDRISAKPLIKLKAASEKLGARYSILVKQYALTKEAFDYWQILQKNTEQRGSLFDAQPSQLKGNIQNLSNPAEPVIGYLSASSVQERRLFIRYADIEDKYALASSCTVTIVSPDSAIFYMEKLKKKPAYFVTGGGLAISSEECVDCTLQGGTNVKPSFW